MTKNLLAFSLLAALMLTAATAHAKVEHLLPSPQQITATQGTSFRLNRPVNISDPTDCTLLKDLFKSHGCAISATGVPVTVTIVNSIAGAFNHNLTNYDNEAYKLDITSDAVNITAVTPVGVIRAAQTLAQLAEGHEPGTECLEAVNITDWPAFKLRGFMHDVGRSFITVDEIKKHIELLSHFKVNTFHWHLTENQAWRFEVKAYPALTSSSSMTRFPGKFYTQADCREVMAVAKKHGVTVIPEIDMPGHSDAFVRAMGCDMQSTQGKEILLKVLEEVAEVFADAPYIHIGADEKTITDNTFLPTMTAKVHALGKKVVCWNPISGVSISANSGFDMTQMWSTSGRVISGMPNIDCRYNYTNHFDVFADLVGIYKSSIYYSDRGTDEIAGTISAPWNDRKTPSQEDIIAQNNFYANVIASAERAWIGGGKQYIEQGGTTLPNSGEEFEEFADWERRFLFHKANSLKNEPIPYVKQTNVRWHITDPFPNGGSSSAVFPPETSISADEYEFNGQKYGVAMATGAGIYLRHTWGGTIPSFYGKTYDTGHTAYAYTYVYSPETQTVGAQIEFQNYGRSERDTAPDAGKWDRKGSRLWINDTEILPPTWTNTGKSINNEVDLGNENFSARQPLQVQLNKGWNKVFIKLPYVNASGVRLNKWMFTFVLTDTEGRNAVDGLIYSPTKCLDAAAENVSSLLMQIKSFIRSEIRDEVGYYAPSEASESMLTAVNQVQETLDQSMTEEERAAQLSSLTAEFTELKATYRNAGIVQPKQDIYYYLHTPNRGSRYLSSNGAGQGATGIETPTKSSAWKFVKRTDNTFNMVNCADGSYLAPTASNNTQISTAATAPSKGWTIQAANTTGSVIVTSGNVQLNQTNSGLGWKIYNWGDGTNTSDDGCKYSFTATDLTSDSDPQTCPKPSLVITDIELDGSAPYRIADEQAAGILSSEKNTFAIDCTPSATPAVACYAAATQTGHTSRYFTFSMLDGNRIGPRYIGQNELEGWYTQNATVTGRHQIVLVNDPAVGYSIYLDGSAIRTIDVSALGEYGHIHFGNVDNADALYLGGLVTADSENKYPFTGTIHSARFWDQSLSAAEVAAIDYTDNKTDIGCTPPLTDKNDIRITVRSGTIDISGTTSPATVYNCQGTIVAEGIKTLSVPSGILLVKVGNEVFKVIVR